jgi:hypothetical protein
VQGQLDRDRSIADLLVAMESVYSFVDALQSLPEKIDALEDIIIKIAVQTVECAIFIREYCGHGFGGRLFLIITIVLADTQKVVFSDKRFLTPVPRSMN